MVDTNPLVVSVVLNWNNYEDTARCLRSLLNLNYRNHTILLVDNGSVDDSADRIGREFPDVDIIYNKDNLGFPGGMNVGIEEALKIEADYIWILNNDVVVGEQHLLEQLVKRLESEPEFGVITPKVTQHPNHQENWFVQGTVNWETGESGHHREVINDSISNAELVENDFIPFCSALFKAEVFESVGLLPEQYFLYREDVEFCGQMIEAGYRIATDTSSKIHHEESKSSGGRAGQTLTYYIARNRWLYRYRWRDRILWTDFLIAYAKWAIMWFVQLLLEEQYRSIWALVRGTVDGIRGYSGRGPYP